MSFQDKFSAAPYLRPLLNVGCLLDIPTGSYHLGARGESILNGGLPNFAANGARANRGKTLLLLHYMLTVWQRYTNSRGLFYETEMTGSRSRINQLAYKKGLLASAMDDLEEQGTYTFTDKEAMDGTEFINALKAGIAERGKEKKHPTPFIDRKGQPICIHPPFVVGIDSFSEFHVAAQEEKQDIDAGDSSRNMEWMNDGRHKTQVFADLNQLAVRGGVYIFLTAHIGDAFNLEPRSTPAKRLQFLKQGSKFKGVPEKFTFLPTNVWEITGTSPMLTDKKISEYPRDSSDKLEGDTDLILASMINHRGKGGPSGMPVEYIYSQSEGIHVGLTEFNYIKDGGRFGITGNGTPGNLQNYHLDLLPEVALSRTTIRGKIETNPLLRRALEITSELLQISQYMKHIPRELLCTPQELYGDLKALGYDWNELLGNTRGYWTFDQYEHPVPFMSTMDCLNMRAGSYVPYWFNKSKLKDHGTAGVQPVDALLTKPAKKAATV